MHQSSRIMELIDRLNGPEYIRYLMTQKNACLHVKEELFGSKTLFVWMSLFRTSINTECFTGFYSLKKSCETFEIIPSFSHLNH
ncbi:hypothetical protein JCM10512_421 [Bacteroides reticulotermitis JCM 10512]|uniref:Uncharacterized protein n=1 Tax=Bacteroides reticulotermitis JCM 10512 TaxID=1445607 RepID=W4UNZ0_9BACE|nr:hypothetical protein JCM10512_421 [Bacteroides reticulotermitis JCM 10512]